MQKFSIHTHTVGYDGKNTVAEMIQHAIKLKWEAIIDTKSSFADWLNNQRVRDELKFDIKVCLIKNG